MQPTSLSPLYLYIYNTATNRRIQGRLNYDPEQEIGATED